MRQLKIVSIFLVCSVFMTIGLTTFAVDNNADEVIKVKLDNEYIVFDQEPVIIGGRTMVPVRKIFEALGATIDWDNNTQTVTAKKESPAGIKDIMIKIGDKEAKIDGNTIELDQAAQVINGRTLVPIRFISEAMGATVDWDDATKTVLITTKTEVKNMVVILKLDDVREKEQSVANFDRVADLVEDKKIKASFGVIAESLENNGNKQAYYDIIKKWHNSGRIEIWHHGYDHSQNKGKNLREFNGNDYEFQYKNFKTAIDLVYDNCGITMTTFGAPFNSYDETFVKVIDEFPQIKIIMFPMNYKTANDHFLLKTRCNIEPSTGVVKYDDFIKNYKTNKDAPYIVLQGHPPMWDEESFENFEKIVDFLMSEGATFMTPYEYYESESK